MKNAVTIAVATAGLIEHSTCNLCVYSGDEWKRDCVICVCVCVCVFAFVSIWVSSGSE